MLSKKLNHPVTIGVADRIRGIDDDRARVLGGFEAIKDFATLAHRKYISAMSVKRSVGVDEFNLETPQRQGVTDTVHDGAVIIDTPGRVIQLAVDAPAGFDCRVH